MSGVSQKIRRFVNHPAMKLSMGFILFISGFFEGYQSFLDFSNFKLGAHHGIMVFGLFNMLASMPDMLEGVGWSAESLERLGQKHNRD